MKKEYQQPLVSTAVFDAQEYCLYVINASGGNVPPVKERESEDDVYSEGSDDWTGGLW